ncbi:predicted protein [Phaeodactylum tricornutum CCAP 1055/1]|uniref:RING-type domain-containing protein n=1 Tax=Phaeodactylum tricornutum (strain CCAP 1055/1) TaxID=556484 RepID=B7FVU2_PHATC|nr:predicted protein [Phaeodactylum tricornutum CCAP 1055/1]EEC49462.1 predicted protein [Phaeodactylum tricornutum CCAP 1055/1]|eukprot:XP_002178764.1 predicted protein [Phaeodactylum tricornutum CCAP 1055/1]
MKTSSRVHIRNRVVVEPELHLHTVDITEAMRLRGDSGTSRRATTPMTSDFDLAVMPREKIFSRSLHSWSAHHSLTTNNWIATIAPASSPSEPGSSNKARYVQIPFPSEREARRFCKAYSPPRLSTAVLCQLCQLTPQAARHCRNCGVTVCDSCSTRWGIRMVPKTYNPQLLTTTVRVCKSCDWLSNAFCMALLQGRYEDVLTIVETGNVNLRTCFADIHQEAMFPVHCAILGGSLATLQWLVEMQGCPLSVKKDPKTNRALSLQTSASRTLLDLAMKGRPKIDILVYLIQNGLSISDVHDPSLAPKTLEVVLKAGFPIHSIDTLMPDMPVITDESDKKFDVSRNKSLVYEESVATLEDACVLCCERSTDCVLIPCGHQICCTDCGHQLTSCPVCKINCSVLRVYRQ